ncbi:MAG: hypothetical protein PHP31_02405 [Lentimicrobiaceae bacterium]|nr:hypothetical protein [Lentimicrobiaceae bacterium]
MKDKIENLLAENPWLEVAKKVKDNSYFPLKKNVYSGDKEYIKRFNDKIQDKDKKLYKYRLKLLPEPFWGNVLDAEIVILTLNPGYVKAKNNDMYKSLHEDEKKKFIKEQCEAMSLKSTEFIPSNPVRNSISDFYWDKRTKHLRDKFKNANSKIALVQYIGYTSQNYKNMYNTITTELLDTQKFTVRLVKYLIEQERVIIIARGKKLWLEAVKELNDKNANLITLDNYRNTYITPNNCKKSGKWNLIEERLDNK